MGNVDDVQHAERDRHTDRDRGIEAAEQQPGHYGVAEEIEGHFHCSASLANAPSLG
jgi:hypothetical protein